MFAITSVKTYLFVEAIIVTVAHPTLRYAMTRPRTCELKVGARLLSTKITLI